MSAPHHCRRNSAPCHPDQATGSANADPVARGGTLSLFRQLLGHPPHNQGKLHPRLAPAHAHGRIHSEDQPPHYAHTTPSDYSDGLRPLRPSALSPRVPTNESPSAIRGHKSADTAPASHPASPLRTQTTDNSASALGPHRPHYTTAGKHTNTPRSCSWSARSVRDQGNECHALIRNIPRPPDVQSPPLSLGDRNPSPAPTGALQ